MNSNLRGKIVLSYWWNLFFPQYMLYERKLIMFLDLSILVKTNSNLVKFNSYWEHLSNKWANATRLMAPWRRIGGDDASKRPSRNFWSYDIACQHATTKSSSSFASTVRLLPQPMAASSMPAVVASLFYLQLINFKMVLTMYGTMFDMDVDFVGIVETCNC